MIPCKKLWVAIKKGENHSIWTTESNTNNVENFCQHHNTENNIKNYENNNHSSSNASADSLEEHLDW